MGTKRSLEVVEKAAVTYEIELSHTYSIVWNLLLSFKSSPREHELVHRMEKHTCIIFQLLWSRFCTWVLEMAILLFEDANYSGSPQNEWLCVLTLHYLPTYLGRYTTPCLTHQHGLVIGRAEGWIAYLTPSYLKKLRYIHAINNISTIDTFNFD